MTEGKLIKVCGMTLPENIREVEALGVDLIGMVFHEKSPRCCRSLPSYLPTKAGRVGVFVDRSEEQILAKVKEYGLSHVQLHGKESPELCRALSARGLKVIKAFGVATEGDIGACGQYEGSCELFLFDTRCREAGGSGRSFDWNVLKAYKGYTPFLLSGGIGPESVAEIRAFSHDRLAGYDINSRFETEAGIKNVRAIEDFIKELTRNLSKQI